MSKVLVYSNGKGVRVDPLLKPDMLCHGQECFLQIPGVCRGDPNTVVPCHANWHWSGKGGALKAKDIFTVPGCWWCHSELDQGKRLSWEERISLWVSAYRRWTVARERLFGVPDHPLPDVAFSLFGGGHASAVHQV